MRFPCPTFLLTILSLSSALAFALPLTPDAPAPCDIVLASSDLLVPQARDGPLAAFKRQDDYPGESYAPNPIVEDESSPAADSAAASDGAVVRADRELEGSDEYPGESYAP